MLPTTLRLICVQFLMLFILALLSISHASSEQGKPTVAVANYPLKYFAERITEGAIDVIYPIPPDNDPAFWNPDPKSVLSFQEADLIVLNGAQYSKWLDKVSLPRRKLVMTSRPFRDKLIRIQEGTTHRHGPKGKHAHSGLAFTTWLDFQQAIQQAEVIAHAVSKLLPQQEKQFQKNYVALKNDLLELDQRLETIVSPNSDQPLVASHPVYHYLARRYGLNIRSVLWEPSEIPTPDQLEELKQTLKTHPAQGIIWEGEPLPQSVGLLKNLGVNSVVFDPAGNTPDQGDFLSIMRENANNLSLLFQ